MDKFMELITFAFLVAIVNVGIRVSLGESRTTGSQSSTPTETPTLNISLTVNSTSSNSSILCNSTNSNCTDGSTINVNTTQLPKNLSTNTITVAIAVNLSKICLSNSTRSLAVYCDGSKLNLTQICVKTNGNISINCVNVTQSSDFVSKPTSSVKSNYTTSTNVSNGNHTLYLNSLGSAPTISVTVATQSLPVTPLAVASSVFKIGASTTTLSPSSVKQFVGTTSISEKSPTTSQTSSTNFTTTGTTTTESTTLQSTTAESKSTASKSTTSESTTLKSTTTQSTVSKSTASVSTTSKSTTSKSTVSKSTASKSTAVESTTLKSTTSESATVKTNEVSTAETKTTKPTSETKPTTKPTTVATSLLQDGETTVATVEETTENQPKDVTVKTHSTKEPSTVTKSKETFKPSFESPEGKNAKEVKFFYVNVLIPIGAGVCGALAIAVAVVMFKCCRRRKLKKVRYFGKPTKHMMYMDQMNLLGDSSDEE